MSDIDEMEIDHVGVPSDIAFSSEGKGKKMSKANLPVSAQDTLPWVEKYRPDTLDDVTGHEDILQTINRFVESNRLPHLLFYGPPGTGKTSTILALARKIYGAQNLRQQVLELNASDDRGIEVVREQIKTFASTRQIFGGVAGKGDGLGSFKLIILDEADAMTSTAQNALRRIMEKYTANTRFCIIANYTHKLNPALLSRCTRFRFSPLPITALRKRVDHVIEAEGIKITDSARESLLTLSRGDMRRSLNVLQACFASSTPLDASGRPTPTQPHEEITDEHIYDCIAAPHPSDIQQIMNTLLKQDVTTSLRTIHEIKTNKGLALADILASLSEELCSLEVPKQTMVVWLEGLAEIEWRVGSGGSEGVQTGGMAGVVRNGVRVMKNK
ncbi:P-loop containing nucleoside triphosphate hydrolase protein [Ascodesmis nigricans]|uniref:Replication factor C subunit 3 n=1 Tax=Ascodesmis nigricans TaxID=341454 RepID=A0A4S2N1L4_9PEZI|nr:P-loop containing nucleoside triphosphate hydrolase protein [Ascodesmis nigricans]